MMSRYFSYLRHADLRFERKFEEARFVAHIERRLVISSAVLSVILGAGSLISLPQEIAAERGRLDDPYEFSVADARSFRLVFLFSVYFLSVFIVLLLSMFWLYAGWLRSLNWEILFTSIATVNVVLICFGNTWTSAKLYGQEPNETWVKDASSSEGSIALSVDTVITCVCLFAPVRMHLKCIPPTCGFFAFCVCFGGLGSPYPEQLALNIFKLLSLSFCALWGAWHAEKVARQNYLAQRLVQRKSNELEVQHAGVSRILDRLCDAFLDLGEDFSIRAPNPRLAAMLFAPMQQDLKGKNFCEFISSEEDRIRFSNAVHGDDGCVEPHDVRQGSGMVQLKLRDYHGREFSVYVYYARTFGLADEEAGHVIALVESQERAPPDAFPSLDILADGSRLSITSKDVRSDASCSSGSGSDITIPFSSEHSAEVAVWINVVGSSDIGCWVQEIINEKLAITIAEVPKIYPISLKLRTSHQSKTEYSARCKPDFESFNWESDADCVLLCLVFERIKCRHRRFKSTGSRHNQGFKTLSKTSVRGFSDYKHSL